MNKAIITLASLLFITISVHAQELSFLREIQIGGSMYSCTNTLKRAGAVVRDIEKPSNGGIYMVFKSGDLMNSLVRLSSQKGRSVSCVEILYGYKFESWDSLYRYYMDQVSKLTAEFGEPEWVREEFVGDQEPGSDYEKLNEVVNGQCEYMTQYSVKDAVLKILITKTKSLMIQYAKD